MTSPSTHHSVSSSAWIEVDLGALTGNARVLRTAIGPEVGLGILVKANGYGHGLEMSARAALAGSADALIVATLDEALALREAGIEGRILVVYPVPRIGVGDAVAAGIELSVSGVRSARETLEGWRNAAGRVRDGTLRLHVEIDSGMGRGGVQPEGLAELLELAGASERTAIAGAWSHLADGSDAAASAEQAARFQDAMAAFAATGRPIPERHLVASEGLLAATAPVHDLVRIGLAFYGELGIGFVPSEAATAAAGALRPALTLKARPVRIEALPRGARVGYGGEWHAERPSIIATLPIGYADGWSRSSWPGSEALARGRRVPLVGRVSMDSVSVDLTDAGEVTMDDELVLLGAQGNERITINEVAERRGTIPNEVLATLGPRLPRRYLDGGHEVAVADRPERVTRPAS